VFAAPSLLIVGDPSLDLLGGTAGVDHRLSPHLAASLSMGVGAGSANTTLTRVSGLSLSSQAALFIGSSFSEVDVGIGPGGRLGWMRLSPEAVTGYASSTVSGVWGGPSLNLRARWHLGRTWRLRLGGEAGVVTLPVQGLVDGNESLAEARGAWLSVALGLAVDL
jgi:hypothetical protein